MSVRVLLVSGRAEIEESLREDPGASAYWVERRPPDLVVPAEVAREFAIALVDFDTCPDGLAMARSLRANKALEVIAIVGAERERLAVESLRSGIFDYLVWPVPEPSVLWGMLGACVRKVQPAAPAFPAPFGRYTLLSLLGVGGMAEVFLAETGTPPRQVVVKRMLQSLAGDEFVAMFMDEARISSMLVHPNIVRVSDFGRVDESLYIAMEYVPGRNLEQLRLALGGPFPPAIACYIVAEMCAGLGHAHSKSDAAGAPQGIVHRDVNPPNVLIADDGRVMITDFGIAKAAHRYYETSSGTLKGKFEYMSPEQANGKVVDRRADIFCAGLVLYELLTGTRPFMAATPIETLFLIQECNPVPPSHWNARLTTSIDAICMKALAKDPADRYSESAELERDLREFARGSMNPGPRDLAMFTRSVPREGEMEESPIPVATAPIPPVPAAAPSDGKVTALLQRKKKKEEDGRAPAQAVAQPPSQPSAKMNPLVAAALADDTPPRPTPVPPRAPVAAPTPAKPPVEAPNARRDPPALSASDAAAISAGDQTVPGVLLDLERLAETPRVEVVEVSTSTSTDEAPKPASEAGASSGGTLIVPADAAPRVPQRTVSAELFPTSARDQERLRFRLQLGGGIAAGLVAAVALAWVVGAGMRGLAGGAPTPYPKPTPFAASSAAPQSSATILAVVPTVTPPTQSTPAIPATAAPSTTPVAKTSPLPTRTAIAIVPPSPTPVRVVAKGTLSVWVDGWATVEIDGRPAGNAPFVGLSLPAGRHRLVLTNGAKVRREVDVVVQPGKEARYSVAFQ